jgi:SWI/SNF-related matrix-associated actin-dependent regulator 1 of chromatin subfamily A
MKTATEKVSILEAARMILAYDPDQAKEKNYVGFNAADGGHVRQFVGYPRLTVAQQQDLHRTMYKYRGQLAELYSINFEADIEKPSTDFSHDQEIYEEQLRLDRIYSPVKKIFVMDEYVHLEFGYNPYLINQAKKIPGARYSYEDRRWRFKPNKDSEAALTAFAKECDFQVPDAVWEFIKQFATVIASSDKSARLDKSNVIIKFDYNAKLVNEVKLIPGRSFNPALKCWTIPFSKKSVIELERFIENNEFSCEGDLAEKIRDLKAEALNQGKKQEENIVSSQAYDAEIDIPGLKGTLRPFQKAGVAYAVKNPRTIIGDEMGLGKTIQAIATVHYKGAYPALVICPNSLKLNWKREWEKWVDCEARVLDSKDSWDEAIRPSAKMLTHGIILIVNYNTAVKFEKELKAIKWQAVISDESHYLKNPKAQRTTAVQHIVKESNSPIVLFLTGTAVVNRPIELTSQLDILGVLKSEFESFWKFAFRYCNARKGPFGWDLKGSSNLDELHRKLRATCYIRRNKEEVLKELPEKQRAQVTLEIDNRPEYTKAENDLVSYLKGMHVTEEKLRNYVIDVNRRRDDDKQIDFDSLTEDQLATLRKSYIDKKVDSAEAAEHLVRIEELKQLSAKGKMASVVDWITDFIESGEKLVVFAHHTGVIKEVAKAFNAKVITGEVSIEDRQKAIDDFQDNPNTKVIVLNLKAGGVGITLTAASNVAFIELGWTPGDMDQAEDRIHRIGQRNAVTAWYLMGQNTIDNDIFELIEEKRVVTEAINAGRTDVKDVKIMNELINRLLSRN